MNRASLYSLAAKLITLVMQFITLLLIIWKISPEIQGYYYTFQAIVALQTIAELGLGTIAIPMIGNFWSKINIKGNKLIGKIQIIESLKNIIDYLIKWYFKGGLLLGSIIFIFGYIFIWSNNQNLYIEWKLQWFFLCLFTTINFILTPSWIVPEGCEYTNKIYGFRLIQSILSNSLCIIGIMFGLELWSLVLMSLATCLISLYIRLYYFHSLFYSLKKTPNSNINTGNISDVKKIQIKFAISWISGYFSSSALVPLVFYFKGSIEAGRVGMTASIGTAIISLVTAWVSPNLVKFGILLGNKKIKDAQNLLRKIYIEVAIIISISLIGLFIVNYQSVIDIDARVLPNTEFWIMVGTFSIIAASVPMSSYLRANKEEPLMYLSVISGLVNISIMVFTLKYYSILQLVIFLLLANFIIILFIPIIFINKLRKQKLFV